MILQLAENSKTLEINKDEFKEIVLTIQDLKDNSFKFVRLLKHEAKALSEAIKELSK